MSQLHILECNLRKVGKDDMVQFYFSEWEKRTMLWLYELEWIFFFFFDWTSISLLQCQGKWLPNGKNKKEKNGKENRDEWKKEQFYG